MQNTNFQTQNSANSNSKSEENRAYVATTIDWLSAIVSALRLNPKRLNQEKMILLTLPLNSHINSGTVVVAKL